MVFYQYFVDYNVFVIYIDLTIDFDNLYLSRVDPDVTITSY